MTDNKSGRTSISIGDLLSLRTAITRGGAVKF